MINGPKLAILTTRFRQNRFIVLIQIISSYLTLPFRVIHYMHIDTYHYTFTKPLFIIINIHVPSAGHGSPSNEGGRPLSQVHDAGLVQNREVCTNISYSSGTSRRSPKTTASRHARIRLLDPRSNSLPAQLTPSMYYNSYNITAMAL